MRLASVSVVFVLAACAADVPAVTCDEDGTFECAWGRDRECPPNTACGTFCPGDTACEITEEEIALFSRTAYNQPFCREGLVLCRARGTPSCGVARCIGGDPGGVVVTPE